VGLAEVADGPIYKIRRYKKCLAGADEINIAVEDTVRSFGRANGVKSADMIVWKLSECIDEYLKPEPEAEIFHGAEFQMTNRTRLWDAQIWQIAA
jgi:hypothetical protein